MSKQLTRAQLVAQLEVSHVAYQKLEAEVARLREHAITKPYVLPAASVASIVAHDNYARALLAAREMAIRSGRSVCVG